MIERLEKMGFQWQVVDHKGAFEKHCFYLEAFKEEFGHCNVPRCSNNESLANWCNNLRSAYKTFQKEIKPRFNLSQDRTDRLEKIDIQWQAIDYDEEFEKHCFELKAFKEEFGHTNVPAIYPKNKSLGYWCKPMR